MRRRKGFVRKNADFFIPVTEKAARALEWEGVERRRMQVLTPGVDTTRFRPRPEERSSARKRWNLPEAAPILLFVGRLEWEKGVWDLLQAARILRERSDRWLLLWVGTGSQQTRLQDVTNHWGLMGRCRWLGSVPYREMASIYAAADVFVAPSLITSYWEEQLGMVLLEGMASGLPVVTAPSGSIPEVVGEAARLVPLHEPKDLAEAIEQLLEDESYRRTLAQRGRERAIECFDRNLFAQNLARIYERLLEA